MPTEKTTLFRLLNLYPAEELKDYWQLKSRTKDEAIEQILKLAEEEEVKTFARLKQEVTKQHLFIFENDIKSLRSFPPVLLPGYVPTASKRTTDQIEEFYLLPVTYKVVIGPPYRDVELSFLWPVSVVATSKFTIVMLTILEKNIDAYLAQGEEALNTQRDIEEDMILATLEDNMPSTIQLTRADLNKGVKALWKADKIDAPMARWKPAKVTMTATMDGKYLLKKDDPQRFEEAIKTPLLKMLFAVVDPKAKYSTQFSVSPSDGELMFNRYTKPEEVSNVVRAILTAN